MEKKFSNNLKFFKPNKNNDGAASQFCFSKDKKAVFIESARQLPDKDGDGNSLFDWSNKIIFKLGIPDIAEILCVLHNIKNSVGQNDKGLFHSNNKGNAVLKFQKGEKSGYYFGISVKKEGSDLAGVKHTITDSEGVLLEILLSRAIELVYDWN